MAAIDKIYGTKKQAREFYQWCKIHDDECFHKTKKYLTDYFYDFEQEIKDNVAITNFPKKIDMWLLENCPIDFVIERIKFQNDL